jgi:hypothetical protein
MIFKYDELRSFFNKIKQKRRVTSLANWKGDNNCIILRHDVDLHVKPAYDLAKLEMECGVESSFFFLTNSHCYNPMSNHNRALIKQISDWGFDVGLHFDPTIYGDISREQMNEYVDFESKMLSIITGKKVQTISLHNPSVHNQYPIFDGYINAYSDKIFSDKNYISDSRMAFRGKDILTFFDADIDMPYQLLLHPLHYTESGGDYKVIFKEYVQELTDTIHNDFKGNSTYARQLDISLFEMLSKKD